MRALTVFWRDLTPLEQATKELEQAKRDHLSAAASREHYSAHEEMLKKRITRLHMTVDQLNKETSDD